MMKEGRTGGAHIWHQDYGWVLSKTGAKWAPGLKPLNPNAFINAT